MERVFTGDSRTHGDHPGFLRNVQESTKDVAVKMRGGLELSYFFFFFFFIKHSLFKYILEENVE